MHVDLTRIKAAALAAQHHSPDPLCAYIYDLEILRRHVSTLRESLPGNVDLFYAVKANSEPPVLKTLAPLVHGFEVASGGELAWVHHHAPQKPVIFGGPGKTDDELLQAIEGAVDALHVESRQELYRAQCLALRLGRVLPVVLRMNLQLDERFQTSLSMGGRPTPFGIEEAQLPDCLATLSASPNLRLRGFHFHLLSHQLDAERHLLLAEACLKAARDWQAEFRLHSLDHINLGGGIGINYRIPGQQYDWPRFSRGLHRLARHHPQWRLRFEFGRYLSAGCGAYVTAVLDIKQCFGEHFIVCRGGTHHFRTPAAQDHSHPFIVLPVGDWPHDYPRVALTSQTASIVGQLCTPKDRLVRQADIAQIQAGDLVLFPYAGAYAWHISHHDFLRHPHPAQIYLNFEEPHAADQPAENRTA